MIQKRQMTWMT